MEPKLWPTPKGHNPPRNWLFETHKELSVDTPIIIDKEGRVSLISHDYVTPHLDHKNKDGSPFYGFKSPTNNKWFHQVATITEDGEMIKTGNLPYGGGHKMNGSFEQRKEYKGDPNRVRIRGRAVETDEFVAICGYLLPGTTEEQVYEMYGAPLSPEFMEIHGRLDFIGPEFVDTTAMPVGGNSPASQEEIDAAFEDIVKLVYEDDAVYGLDGAGDLVYASRGAMAQKIKQQFDIKEDESMYKEKLEKIEAVLASRDGEEGEEPNDGETEGNEARLSDIESRLESIEGELIRLEAERNSETVPDEL